MMVLLNPFCIYVGNEPSKIERIKSGQLPEMHCWVGIPSTQEIVNIMPLS